MIGRMRHRLYYHIIWQPAVGCRWSLLS